jgi:hypothetical protein
MSAERVRGHTLATTLCVPLNGLAFLDRVVVSLTRRCHMLDNMTVKLGVTSTVVRDALRDGCAWVIRFEQKDRESTERGCGCNPARCERRIALATALDEQLEAGYAVVDVPVEVADGVARNVAEVIGEEMAALVCDKHDMQPRGAILRRADGLMETLVALDAGIQRQVVPFDTFTLARP